MGLFAMKILFSVMFGVLAVLAVSSYRRRVRLRRCLPAPPDVRGQAAADFLATGGVITAAAALFLAIWLSRPAATAPEPETAVFFLLDSSASMLAESQSADRLHEAKTAIAGMLADLPELPVALVTFAGNAMLDFPPSPDNDNFRRALDAVAPATGFIAGSAPAAALRLAEDTARAVSVKPILVMLSDGEINTADSARENTLWTGRQSPLLIVITGIPGAAKPIPADNGWMMDPDTGTTALSTATDRDLVRLAKLSAAPWFLADDASPAAWRRRLPRLLATAGASPIPLQRRSLARTALLAAMLLLTAWVFLKRGLLRQSRRKASPDLRATAVFLSLTTLATAQTAATPATPRADRQRLADEAPPRADRQRLADEATPRADRQRLADDIRNQLQRADLPTAERARLLANWAALLCRESPEHIAPGQARQNADDAVALCREALRLAPGYQPAITNLVAARQCLERLPQHQDMPAPTTTAPSQPPATPTQTPAQPKPQADPDRQALAPPQVQPAPTGASATSGLQPAEASTSAAAAASRHAAGSWRDLQTRRRAIPPRSPGVKPW